MAMKSLCSSCCRRVLRKELQSTTQISSTSKTPSRAFATTRPFSANDPNKTPPPPRSPPQSQKPLSASEQARVLNFASELRTKGRPLQSTTEPYFAYSATEDLFQKCAEQCDYTIPSVKNSPPEPPPQNAAGEHIGEGTGWWITPKSQGGLGLDATFNTWAQVLMLHMWMLTARVRAFPPQNARTWHQHLLDHFFHAAEDRMVVWHRIDARGTRNKYLKDLLSQWRGVILSYDEGIIRGDAELATAVWRNVFKAAEDVDVRDLAVVTAYMRRELKRLDQIPDVRLAQAEVHFASPSDLVQEMRDIKA